MELPIIFCEASASRSEVITFDVVYVPYAYNAILGRGTLYRFEAIPHHNYLCLKMPGPQGLITIHED